MSRVTVSPRIRRGTLAGALCAAVLLTLPACGAGTDEAVRNTGAEETVAAKKPAPFADLSGPEIAEKALAALHGASSVTVQADVHTADEGHVVFDLTFGGKGDCAGTLSMNDEGAMALTKVGRTVYMKYDEEFLRAQNKGEPADETDAMVEMIADRWVKTDVSAPDSKDLVAFCDLDEVLADFKDVGHAARRGELGEVNGLPSLILTEATVGGKYTLHVATEGEPYLLSLTETGKEPGTMTFKDFGKPFAAKAPATKDIVDLDKLGE
ncbi:hypothetical protein [Streptomyces sp. NPDC051569]|uniref:hypothetical protein n=1 Tax=Streptomyces sp. NPDC051569 TaxID=3365661 RepID=UPI0037AB245E